MSTDTEVTEVTEEEQNFSKGFSNVFTEDKPPKNDAESVDNNQVKEETTKPESEVIAEDDKNGDQDTTAESADVIEDPLEVIKKLKLDKRKLQGKIGELTMNRPVVSPVVEEVNKPATELKNPEAMRTLNDDFPEVSPVTVELNATNVRLDDTNRAMDKMRNELRKELSEDAQLIAFNMRHPDGLDVINQQGFIDWSIDGGPPKEDYQEMKGLKNSSEDDRYTDRQKQMLIGRSVQMINSWEHMHPEWWASKGSALFDESAVAASALLDNYKSHSSALSNRTVETQKRHKRIKAAVTPTGSGSPPSTEVSDEQSFSSGFNKVYRR